ncbi:hypothetical protein ASF33_17850 [Methylobacterium sp. Leaf92]|nr:hypothetical protein ASF33_17850 [Methylobacterium sp. Leaf92]
MDDPDSNVEKLAGLALGVGRLYIGFWKWLLRIMVVVFGLIALGIWLDNVRSPEDQHGIDCKRAYLYRQGMPDPSDWNSPIPGCDLSLRYYQPK